MQKLEELSMKTLYRGILQGIKIYPSKNRDAMRQAIIGDVSDWKKVKGEEERQKAVKKMRMLYSHIAMWNLKMEEVHRTDTDRVDTPLPFKDINHKEDKDFVYF